MSQEDIRKVVVEMMKTGKDFAQHKRNTRDGVKSFDVNLPA